LKNISYIDDFEKWQQSFSFSISLTVRFSETDAFGHLNNTVPFTYFEDARIAFLSSLGFEISLDQPTILVVADLQCDFIKQVFFNEKITLYTTVNNVGNTSFDIHYMAKNDQEQICFVGRGKLVLINKKTGKPTPLDKEFKNGLINS
jgi:acyl-CoA thioester hydrolase